MILFLKQFTDFRKRLHTAGKLHARLLANQYEQVMTIKFVCRVYRHDNINFMAPE